METLSLRIAKKLLRMVVFLSTSLLVLVFWLTLLTAVLAYPEKRKK